MDLYGTILFLRFIWMGRDTRPVTSTKTESVGSSTISDPFDIGMKAALLRVTLIQNLLKDGHISWDNSSPP
jgi:hypothetical protein